MFTFIISFVLTSFICLCFFKKNFWENRYLILFINSGVALVATLVINFSVRGNLQTKTEIIYTKPLHVFYLPEKLIPKYSDSTGMQVIQDYNYYGKHNASEFFKDTTKKQLPVTIILYQSDKNNIWVGTFKKAERQDYFNTDAIYIVRSSADSVAYVSKKRQFYDAKSNWISGLSLPCKSTITILHIPPKEYDMIPDSFIRPLPF